MRSHFCPHRKVCESGVCTMCAQERLALTAHADIVVDAQAADSQTGQ